MIVKRITNMLLIIVILTFAGIVHSAPGDLDFSFSGDGKLTTSFGMGAAASHSVLVQTDGKIVAVGYHEDPNDFTHADIVLARYNPSGSLDSGFGSNGKVVTSFKKHDYAEPLDAAMSGNRIYVVGNFLVNNSTHSIFITCYRKDGSLDTSFDDDGIKILSQPYQPMATGIAIQSDGKLVVAASDNVDSDFHIVRFDQNGVLDTAFGSNGIATLDFTGALAHTSSIAIQAGKIVIGGWVNQSGNTYVALARFNIDGTLDTAFGNNGVTIFDQQALTEYCHDLALQNDGKILLTGSVYGAASDFLVARFSMNGTLDTTFGIQGWLAVDFQNQSEFATKILVQHNGRIIVSGWSANYQTNESSFAMVRLLSTGTLDSSFGTNGRVTTQFSNGSDGSFGAALQSDEKVVLSGRHQLDEFAIARYLTN